MPKTHHRCTADVQPLYNRGIVDVPQMYHRWNTYSLHMAQDDNGDSICRPAMHIDTQVWWLTTYPETLVLLIGSVPNESRRAQRHHLVDTQCAQKRSLGNPQCIQRCTTLVVHNVLGWTASEVVTFWSCCNMIWGHGFIGKYSCWLWPGCNFAVR